MTTILVVDDDLDMRLLIRMVIEMANQGLEIVAEAVDGREAMSVWRGLHGPPAPDVVILDNRMPHASGLDVAREILKERPGQIVVLYSAFLDDQVRAEAAEAGIAACVTKENVHTLPAVVRGLAARESC